MRTSEVLNLAADAIQKYGWRQGDGWDNRAGKGLCLEGGIIAAMGIEPNTQNGLPPDNWFQCPAYKAVEEYLTAAGELKKGHWVFTWNDRDATTAERVIAVLRATALIEQTKEDQSIKNEIKEEVSA